MKNRFDPIKNMISKLISKIIHVSLHDLTKIYAISLLTFFSCSSFANNNTTCEEIKIKPCSVKEINVSDKYNFFSIQDEEIKSIIGDVSNFDIQRLNKKILFLPKVKKELLISIITVSGKIQKLLLRVKKIPPQEINLNISIDKIDSYQVPKSIETKSLKFLSKIMNGLIQFEPVNEKTTTFNSKALKLKRELPNG